MDAIGEGPQRDGRAGEGVDVGVHARDAQRRPEDRLGRVRDPEVIEVAGFIGVVEERGVGLGGIVEVRPIRGPEREEVEVVRVGVVEVAGAGVHRADRHLAVGAGVAVVALRQHRQRAAPGVKPQVVAAHHGAARERPQVAQRAVVHLVDAGRRDRELDPLPPRVHGVAGGDLERTRGRGDAGEPGVGPARLVVHQHAGVDALERVELLRGAAARARGPARQCRRGCGHRDFDLDAARDLEPAPDRIVVRGQDRDARHALVAEPAHAQQPRARARRADRVGARVAVVGGGDPLRVAGALGDGRERQIAAALARLAGGAHLDRPLGRHRHQHAAPRQPRRADLALEVVAGEGERGDRRVPGQGREAGRRHHHLEAHRAAARQRVGSRRGRRRAPARAYGEERERAPERTPAPGCDRGCEPGTERDQNFSASSTSMTGMSSTIL